MNIFLDDTTVKANLFPFTATRHTADIRVGILTIREKWNYLIRNQDDADIISSLNTNIAAHLKLDANLIPTKEWINDTFNSDKDYKHYDNQNIDPSSLKAIEHPWSIFQLNAWALQQDFEMITAGRISQPISPTNQTIGGENIFLEAGALVEHSILNASAGPIYIGKNAQVMEGCMIRGGFALCEGAILKMGSKVYGATTIGPYCTAGGEIKNSVMFGYSNKAHDGYLGDSVIGEWCNLGAGTTNSNVKNSAGEVKVWSNTAAAYLPVGLKCGVLMGDYSRAAINTSFNTGTVVGVCCNIFGAEFPPKFIPSFTWGKERYTFAKILDDINNWKRLKGQTITEQEKSILQNLYTQP